MGIVANLLIDFDASLYVIAPKYSFELYELFLKWAIPGLFSLYLALFQYS